MESEALEQEVGSRNDGGAKRRQIIDGARAIFLSAGFDGASMNDIAHAAGVSKGTLYAYFNSKEHLFEAIIRVEYAQAAERLCTFKREGDVREILTDFGVRLISRMAEPGTLALARVVIAAVEISKYRPRLLRGGTTLRRNPPPFYRLNVFPIFIPALKERKDDIPRLAYYFLKLFCRKTGKRVEGFTDEALETLIRYDWPGNVRELKNVVERLVILAEGKTLESVLLLPYAASGRIEG